MDTKEIVHFAKQIDKSNADRSYGDILTLLADLDNADVTTEQLETTDIVKVLYRTLKTCSDSSMKKTIKGLLAKWKRQYGRNTQGVQCNEENPPGLSCGDFLSNQSGDRGESKQEEGKYSAQAQTGSPASAGSSSVRSKCVQFLLAALSAEQPDQAKALNLSENIEKHIHDLHKSSVVKYKACIRSKVANLRNPKNSHLQQGLLNGSLSPETFARMSAEEMASSELRQLREEYSSQGVNERQLPQGVEGTKTHKIQCKRCGGSDCSVTQVSRGALFLPAWVRRGGPDEDAMTFVTCGGCGQQWYHNGWICL